MKIYLKNNQIDPCEKNKRYTAIGTPNEVKYKGKKYTELTYIKKLNGLECFARGLAWALSYLTIIPALFCRARIQEMFREARAKKETKIIYIPTKTPELNPEEPLEPEEIESTFEKLKDQIDQIKRKPTFIDDLIEAEPSEANNNELQKWINARNKLVFWEGLCEQLNKDNAGSVPKEILSITEFESIEKTVEKANKFNAWFAKHEKKLKTITTLTTLQSKQLTQLPKEISLMPQITRLDLQNNLIAELPTEIAKLKKLNRLDLRNNGITEFPPVIYQLKELTHLYLGKNQLTALPAQIGRLGALEELNLADNQLRKLPKEIGKLKGLKILVLEDNKIKKFPQEIDEIINSGNLRIFYADKVIVEQNKELFEAAKEKGIKIERPSPTPPAPAEQSAEEQRQAAKPAATNAPDPARLAALQEMLARSANTSAPPTQLTGDGASSEKPASEEDEELPSTTSQRPVNTPDAGTASPRSPALNGNGTNHGRRKRRNNNRRRNHTAVER